MTMLSPAKVALLRDVAIACRQSIVKDHQRAWRSKAMREIALDPRLHSKARHTQASLINDVMGTLNVSRPNARVIVCRARKANP